MSVSTGQIFKVLRASRLNLIKKNLLVQWGICRKIPKRSVTLECFFYLSNNTKKVLSMFFWKSTALALFCSKLSYSLLTFNFWMRPNILQKVEFSNAFVKYFNFLFSEGGGVSEYIQILKEKPDINRSINLRRTIKVAFVVREKMYKLTASFWCYDCWQIFNIFTIRNTYLYSYVSI